MSARKLLRIFLVLVVLALLWMRGLISWPLAVVVLLLVVVLLAGVFRKRRLPRDDVPKHPLGLDN
jgi:membrane protein implicated in regulation of membrane protease activity